MIIARISLLTLLAAYLSACVTINVYFPAAAAEKAADQIIDKVWGDGKKDEAPKSDDGTQKPKDQKKSDKSSLSLPNAWNMALNTILTPVQAADADLDISTPEIEALQNSLAKRFKQLNSYYSSGAVGLTNDGMVELRDSSSVPLNQRGQVNKLVQAENGDRQNLYRAIAAANRHPEWADEIQQTFAKRWIGRAQKGWWYQTPKGEWKQK